MVERDIYSAMSVPRESGEDARLVALTLAGLPLLQLQLAAWERPASHVRAGGDDTAKAASEVIHDTSSSSLSSVCRGEGGPLCRQPPGTPWSTHTEGRLEPRLHPPAETAMICHGTHTCKAVEDGEC